MDMLEPPNRLPFPESGQCSSDIGVDGWSNVGKTHSLWVGLVFLTVGEDSRLGEQAGVSPEPQLSII